MCQRPSKREPNHTPTTHNHTTTHTAHHGSRPTTASHTPFPFSRIINRRPPPSLANPRNFSDLASPSNGTPAAKHAEAILSPASPAPAEPLSHDLTGESKGNVSDDSIERKKIKVDTNLATTVGSSSHVAELEDTAEARQRTIRIDGQEEKIAYDPEEENPKMSATSYPGQEWNPYGEPGFGDWQE
ncbi:hypothetical protein NLG97_g2842 [Lecanicillium saksenae]|uniref:Uncharacterized protein n=1 Tax=Lecanicillium saksenae TaxID=468837 RepID=A0ACC1QZQ9_9HYPO|nr:hypothetical protein NLG97_g2842 [Lecanicillium saksenae]